MMHASRLAAILAVISNNAPEATVVGELDHAGYGQTLRVNYNGPCTLNLKEWEAGVLDDHNVHLNDGHAIVVVNFHED